MIQHIVLFTWNDKVPAGHETVAANELRRYAATLDGLVSYHCGPNLGYKDGTLDFGVAAVFEDFAAWQAYDIAPEHDRIRAEIFGPYVDTRAVIQFEV
jgi:hypothetical protein